MTDADLRGKLLKGFYDRRQLSRARVTVSLELGGIVPGREFWDSPVRAQ